MSELKHRKALIHKIQKLYSNLQEGTMTMSECEKLLDECIVNYQNNINHLYFKKINDYYSQELIPAPIAADLLSLSVDELLSEVKNITASSLSFGLIDLNDLREKTDSEEEFFEKINGLIQNSDGNCKEITGIDNLIEELTKPQ